MHIPEQIIEFKRSGKAGEGGMGKTQKVGWGGRGEECVDFAGDEPRSGKKNTARLRCGVFVCGRVFIYTHDATVSLHHMHICIYSCPSIAQECYTNPSPPLILTPSLAPYTQYKVVNPPSSLLSFLIHPLSPYTR